MVKQFTDICGRWLDSFQQAVPVLVGPHQTALSREVPGTRIDVRQLETNKPIGIPISIRISGADAAALHQLSSKLHSGPLCYAQIGGLPRATFITLLLVPVLYSIFVKHLKVIHWEVEAPAPIRAQAAI
jgi:hypothetical protein